MSSKRGSLNRSTALAAGVGFAALISVALLPPPALADKWKHHHHGHYDYDYDGRGYVVVPGYVYHDYYSPPPVYYTPPQVYYQPPDVYYQPPPVYYGPPSLNFGINVPLR